MANSKISEFPAKSVLDPADLFLIVDSDISDNAHITYATLAAALGGGDIGIHAALTSGTHGVTGNIVGTTDAQTLTNKTLTTPTIASFANAGHNHQSAAGGGTLVAAAITDLASAVAALAPPAMLRPTFAASFTPAPTLAQPVIELTLTGNITAFNAPSGSPVDGQQMVLLLWQDATGNRTIAGINAIYRNFPTIASAANSCTKMAAVYSSGKSAWVF
jgi:hypothetical protein